MKVTLCHSDEISDPGSMGFSVDPGNGSISLFVVRKDGEFFAYINSCPHTRVGLDWVEHRFLDQDNDFIQCANHDALFEIPTGLCVSGPCIGASLSPVSLSLQDSVLVAEVADAQD